MWMAELTACEAKLHRERKTSTRANRRSVLFVSGGYK
jgi:hypothetical protein